MGVGKMFCHERLNAITGLEAKGHRVRRIGESDNKRWRFPPTLLDS